MIKMVVVVLLVSALLIAGCTDSGSESKKTPQEITVAVSKLEATSLVRIAQSQGFFEKHGLNVKFTEQDLGKFSFQELLLGNADIATLAESPVVAHSFHRDDYVVFGTIHSSNSNIKLIATSDIKKNQDLEGKRIGITRGTVGEFYLHNYLVYHSINTKDITIVDGKPDKLKVLLEDGSIDAFALREPHVFKTKELLKEKVNVFSSDHYIATFNVVAMSKFVNQNPEIIHQFLLALIDAENFLAANKKQAIDIVSSDLQLDKNYLQKTWEESDFSLTLPQTLILTMESQANWRIQNKLTNSTEVPNYLDYIYIDALDEIDQNRVEIIH